MCQSMQIDFGLCVKIIYLKLFLRPQNKWGEWDCFSFGAESTGESTKQ